MIIIPSLFFFSKGGVLPQDITINKLLGTIDRIFSGKYNKARCKKMIEDYRKQGMTYQQIENALIYWFDVKDNDTDYSVTHGGIGIVPYILEDSERFWEERERLKNIGKTAQESQEQEEVAPIQIRVTGAKKPLYGYVDLTVPLEEWA